MKDIIALRGRAESGKTETIRNLHNLFLSNGYKQIRSNFNNKGGDFTSIFSKNEKQIGITSWGDTYDFVHNKLQELINCNCNICVCACRTYDRSSKGTNYAIKEFSNYNHLFVEKKIDDNNLTQKTTNQRDAMNLFQIIDNSI